MVVTVLWTSSWLVPIISITVLCVGVIFLLFCLCIQKRQNRKTFQVSNSSLSKLMIFRKCQTSSASLPVHEENKDLLDSVDVSHRFTSSKLKIDNLEDFDEAKSCDSTDSRFTFYSTYPGFGRSDSTASDYKSTRDSFNKTKSFSNFLQ
ncbi:uncharacterized protein LOC123003966 [Tribolium madens]|uniref:uncharacterized protein LOC123003966 n=1 Tax=Tribolium madens TaxID=41895 RepID=UPI001CF723CC|nr:uncharacterized protein LOC123003966 [Tribolium madens]